MMQMQVQAALDMLLLVMLFGLVFSGIQLETLSSIQIGMASISEEAILNCKKGVFSSKESEVPEN